MLEGTSPETGAPALIDAPPRPPVETSEERPRLVIFVAPRSGACRRVDGYLAAVLQRRANHHAFELLHVDIEKRPDLAERFRVSSVPTLLVIEAARIRRRLTRPKNALEIGTFLGPWLQ